MRYVRVREVHGRGGTARLGSRGTSGRLPDEVVDVLGLLLVDKGPRDLADRFSSLSEYPLTPPTVKMNSAGSSSWNCRNRSTLALTRLAVGASYGAL